MAARAVDRVVEAFGGMTRMARALGHPHCTTVQGWKARGAIPLRQHGRILEAAREHGIALARDDLLDDIPLIENDEDAARAQVYRLIAGLLEGPPSGALLEAIGRIEGDAQTEFGRALAALAAVARRTTPEAAEREHTILFVGMGAGNLQPYASYYLTGFLHERPLADLRADMAALGIARREGVKEPEDHIAALCAMMGGLIAGEFGAAADLDTQRRFFERHVGAWAPRFFEDLEAAPDAAFYMPVARLARVFLAIERDAFGLET